MNKNYKVEYYDYNNRYKNLEVKAQGVVKSEKFFPVFLNNGQEEIFKPLSKTKPYLTPFFAYSEVFWSRVINKYFDENTPVYRLAICNHYNESVPKYHNHGTIVPSVLKEDEKLVNLLEYFRDNPDPEVDINKYVNYCMKFYDYTHIFNSKLIKENYSLGESLARQVLLSILKADQNFHYENISFITKDEKITKLSPPIDHEFSSMFMFLDDPEKHNETFNEFIEKLTHKKEYSQTDKLLIECIKEEGIYSKFFPIQANLDIIVERYKGVVQDFLERLELFVDDLRKKPIDFKNNNYIQPFNSNNFEYGIKMYKENNIEEAQKIKSELIQTTVDLDVISNLVQREIIETATTLKEVILKKLEKDKIKVR